MLSHLSRNTLKRNKTCKKLSVFPPKLDLGKMYQQSQSRGGDNEIRKKSVILVLLWNIKCYIDLWFPYSVVTVS